MIRSISGTVTRRDDQTLLIETSAGIGYQIYVTNQITARVGDTLQLYTHQAVRETAADLYGFRLYDELELFELLLTIPKVGPKSALQIMNQANRDLIYEAVGLHDAVHLSKLSGIGKKTAEKIVSTLQDKLPALPQSTPTVRSNAYQDAFDTLITLGYEPGAIRTMLETIETPESTTSSLVKNALQKL